MDRRTRPTFARRRIAGAVTLALCTAGCGGNSYVSYSSSSAGAGIPAGTSGYIQGSTSSSSAALAAVFLLHWSLLNERWDRGGGMAGSPGVPAPPMDESRTVNTQDCTRPIEDWSANLKCR